MQDKLIEVLNKIAETRHPNKLVLVKKAIVEFCQKQGYQQNQTLNFLNDILALMKEDAVTLGCVKYHWNK